MKTFILSLLTFLSLSVQAADYADLAKQLPGRTLMIDAGSEQYVLQINHDRTMTLITDRWGKCSGAFFVGPGDSSETSIILDNGGLFCSKLTTLPKYIMFQLEVPSDFNGDSKGILNISFKGRWVVSYKSVSISE